MEVVLADIQEPKTNHSLSLTCDYFANLERVWDVAQESPNIIVLSKRNYTRRWTIW